uniref:CUB domain-containing protein n=1 Tax=Plectus sambesii TaxID=2011161 RepID=A0A914WIZ3_9BILA
MMAVVGLLLLLAFCAATLSSAQVTTPPTSNPQLCPPSNYTGLYGTIASPGFSTGQYYGNNLRCQYLITVPAGYMVLLTTNAFRTEQCCDKLYIYDGPDATSPLLATWSGTVPAGTQLQSTGSAILATFVTDGSKNDIGFSVLYSQSQTILLTTPPPTLPPSPSACLPSNYSGPYGVLLSPGFSTSQNYGNNLNCIYQITVPVGYTILLTVNSFITEVCCDKLSIYDGASINSPLLAVWSGTVAAGQQKESTGNTLTARFVTDGSNNFAGFSIIYSQSKTELLTTPAPTPPPSPNQCLPSNYTGPYGAILSPGFTTGQNYGNNLNCKYFITVQANYMILLTVNSFLTEQGYDKLSIYNGPNVDSSTLLTTWSGRVRSGTSVQSSGNTLTAVFFTDGSNNFAGFSVLYSLYSPTKK